MAKLPIFELNDVPQWQIARLDSWLEQWRSETHFRETEARGLILPELPSAPPGKDFPDLNTLRGQGYDDGVRSGQIRLLSSKVLPLARRPVFVAVLSEWTEDLKLVVPYGPFTIPGTTGELLTDRPDPALQVLCLWNSHTLPAEAIDTSWIVDELSPTELSDAWAIFQYITFGTTLPASLAQRVGPPVVHPRDPRRLYQKDEMSLMAPLARRAIEWERRRFDSAMKNALNVIPLLPAILAAQAFRQAAAVPEAAREEWVYQAQALEVECVLRLEGDQRTIGVYVYDLAGEDSMALDGACILDSNQKEVGTIANGRASVPAELVREGFVLRGADSTPIKLHRRE